MLCSRASLQQSEYKCTHILHTIARHDKELCTRTAKAPRTVMKSRTSVYKADKRAVYPAIVDLCVWIAVGMCRAAEVEAQARQLQHCFQLSVCVCVCVRADNHCVCRAAEVEAQTSKAELEKESPTSTEETAATTLDAPRTGVLGVAVRDEI